jgi:hypothetical protein
MTVSIEELQARYEAAREAAHISLWGQGMLKFAEDALETMREQRAEIAGLRGRLAAIRAVYASAKARTDERHREQADPEHAQQTFERGE